MSLKKVVVCLWLFSASCAFSWSDEQVPTKETEALDFAQSLLSRGMYDMAIAEYQKFITAYPQSTYLDDAHFAIGETYFLSQDFAKAAEAFNQFKTQFPNSNKLPAAVLRLGQMDIQQKKYDEAIKELTAVDAARFKARDMQALYFYMAQADEGKGDAKAALEDIQKSAAVAQTGPLTPYVFEELGQIQAKNRQYKEAGDAYTKALEASPDDNFKGYLTYRLAEVQFLAGNYQQSIEQFRQILEKFPTLDVAQDAYANLLLAHFNLGQYDQLLAVYHTHNDLIKEQGRYFDIHFAAVRALVEQKLYDDALKLLDKVLAFPSLQDVDKHRGVVEKADILIRTQKYQEALGLLENAGSVPNLDLDKETFLKAQAYYGLKDFKRAYDTFQTVINSYPQSNFVKAALLGVANCSQQLGNHKEASDVFIKYYNAEEDPDLKAQALYDAALMSAQTEDQNQAIDRLQQYLKDYPKGKYYEPSILLLADLYGKAKQPDKAVGLLQDYATHPENIQRPDAVYFLLGYHQQLQGQVDQALETYKKVTPNKDDPKFYAWALKNTASIYLSKKDDADALALFKRVSDLDQNYLELKTYIWLCNELLKGHQHKEVLEVAQKTEKFFPNQAQEEIAYFKAEAYRGLKNFEQAGKFYDVVLASPKKDSFTGSAHIGKGLYLGEAKKFEEAKSEFQKAVDENGEDNTITLRARFELGNIASQENNLNDALRFYLLVATLYNDDYYCPESLWRSGQIFEQLKSNDQALKNYQEIVTKYKNSAAAKLAAERIAALK
jgi:tol-pal system protein YbgF